MDIILYFSIFAILIIGGQILYLKILHGDADRALNDDSHGPRIPRWIRAKTLRKKAPAFYHDKLLPMRYLALYMSVILPALCLLTLRSVIDSIILGLPWGVGQIVYFFFSLSCFVNFIFIHKLDNISFYANIAMHVFFIAYIITDSGSATIFLLTVWGPLLVIHFAYFCRRRNLFFKTYQNPIA